MACQVLVTQNHELACFIAIASGGITIYRCQKLHYDTGIPEVSERSVTMRDCGRCLPSHSGILLSNTFATAFGSPLSVW